MTSAPVTNSSSYFMNVTRKGAENSKQNALQQDFTQVMGKAANTQTEPKAADVSEKRKPNTALKEDTKPNAIQEKVHKTTNESTADRTGKTATNAENEIAEKAIEEKTDELIGKAAEELGISEEEVLAAMEALGMQMIDLLNPDMMAQLVIQISGEPDMMSLVMDEGLYSDLKNLLQTVETALKELQEELSATPEELQDIMAEISTEESSIVDVPKGEPVIADSQSMSKTADETTGKTVNNMAETETGTETGTGEPEETMVKTEVKIDKGSQTMEEADNKSANQDTAVQTDDGEEEKQIVLAEEIDQTDSKKQPDKAATSPTADLEKPMEVTKEQNAAPENNSKKDNGSESNQSFLQNYMDKVIRETTDILKTAEPLGTADTESIMKQMMDSIKLHVGTTITEMEIQLQPANLGNINLQVAMKNGVVTAQITAETEAVKKALESQVVQLRENLNEQGIKIEAVEVTIASHEFERNLNQGQQSAQSEEAQKGKEAGRKRLVLDELDAEAEEALEEKDKIQVQMMKQSGNTVNLTA